MKDNNLGGAIAIKKGNIWDEKVQELDIPELESAQDEQMQQSISAPAPMVSKMMALAELDKDMVHNVPTMIEEGVDLSLLTSVVRPIVDLIEADI